MVSTDEVPADEGHTHHPRFSAHEMVRRCAAVDRIMAESDVDHVVVYGANRSGSAVQWLTQWPVTREAVVVHTPGLADTLLVDFYNHVPLARRMAPQADVRWAGRQALATAVSELRSRGAGTRTRVGIIGPVPFSTFGTLSAEVGEVVDLGGAYTQLRMVKSAEEITWLRRAAELTDASAAAVREQAQPGSSEHDLVAMVEGAYLHAGGSNHIHYFSMTSMSDPRQCVPSQWPADRTLEIGDVLAFELSTSWGVDYPGQLLRTFTVGADPTSLVHDLHAVADEALHRIEQVLRPGLTPAEVVEVASVIEDAGFTTVDDLVHGLGGGYLPPVFGSRSRTLDDVPGMPFSEGMTVVVQPNVTTQDRRIGVQTGELLHVTANGCERLHRFPRGMGRIA